MWWDPREQIDTEQAMLAARLAGRHDNDIELLFAMERGNLDGADILRARQAFKEGKDERARGVKCLCIQCRDGLRPAHNESLRRHYWNRRFSELRAQGHDLASAAPIIDAEIAQGAAR